MPQVELTIPQIGEGLQEARVVALLKQPGDRVKRDEPIYQMETDKAVMDVESPYEGTVVRWLAAADDVLAIGAPVLVMETADEVSAPVGHAPAAAPAAPAPSAGTPGVVSLRIPQIGEGLQEARLVAKLKNVGDSVKRDEAIYQMETDKAVMDVECPYEGTVHAWTAEVDEVLPIGAEVMVLATTDPTAVDQPAGHGPATPAPVAAAAPAAAPTAGERRRDIPPRTRAYAKQKGLSEADLATIPAAGSKLMPEDIDAFLAGGTPSSSVVSGGGTGKTAKGRTYSEFPMASRQRVLASRLQRGNQLVVPGMMTILTHWGGIEEVRDHFRAQGGEFAPSAFTIFAYCVARAARNHPVMRSTLVGDGTVRTFDHLHLGIAVARPGDELVIAVVEDADDLDFRTFADRTRARISAAREGQDQADESVTLSITNMQAYDIHEAMAVVVPPAVATIFLGEPYIGIDQKVSTVEDWKVAKLAHVGITIDHRIINGVGGAEFLRAIRDEMDQVRSLITG